MIHFSLLSTAKLDRCNLQALGQTNQDSMQKRHHTRLIVYTGNNFGNSDQDLYLSAALIVSEI